MKQPEVYRVSAKTDVHDLAGAINGLITDHGVAELAGVGADAINNIVKSVAIAIGQTATEGKELWMRPKFFREPDKRIPGQDLVGLQVRVKPLDL